MADSVLLEVDDLSVTFGSGAGEVAAVRGVSFNVMQQQIVGIVGESGSGKTVTARSILDLLPSSARVDGSARYCGRELLGNPVRVRREIRGSSIAYVSQHPWAALNPVMRIGEQFKTVIGRRMNMDRREVRSLAIRVLEKLGISDPERVLDGYAHELSGGMAQRVALGIVLSLNPTLLIADEPTTALDLTVQRQLLDRVEWTIRREGLSLIIITHDLSIVASYCEDVVVMYEGKVVETGPVSEVFLNPRHEYTRHLLQSAPR